MWILYFSINFEKVGASAKSNSKEDLHNLFNEQEIATIEQGEQVTLDPTRIYPLWVKTNSAHRYHFLA
jgi:hypothetical protein